MANNQEYHRLTSSSEMDERTMREIYLASFEGMVKEGKAVDHYERIQQAERHIPL